MIIQKSLGHQKETIIGLPIRFSTNSANAVFWQIVKRQKVLYRTATTKNCSSLSKKTLQQNILGTFASAPCPTRGAPVSDMFLLSVKSSPTVTHGLWRL